MQKYIEDLTDLIERCSFDNTYKMSWIRSIVEICEIDCKEEIHFDEISERMFGYYWDQTIWWNFKQGSGVNEPKIVQIVKEEIEKYQNRLNSNKPEKFIKIKNDITIPVHQISTVLTQDVSHRFLNLRGRNPYTHIYSLNDRMITLNEPQTIKNNAKILYRLINYRWVEILEKFNTCPRITAKVRGVERNEVPKRESLKKFHEFLDYENENKICFISGKEIPPDKLSVHHVIPWSYLYSDDLWNLVYTNKDINSSQGNQLPDDKDIEKLAIRNKELLSTLLKNNINNKHVDQLKYAVEKENFLQENLIGCRG